jgi:2Fe-2S ferredoxin
MVSGVAVVGAHVLVMARLVFQRRGPEVAVDVPLGQSVLTAAIEAGLPLGNSCGGERACRACRIEVLAGKEHLSPVEAREGRALVAANAAPGERLACAARVLGDVIVTTSYW